MRLLKSVLLMAILFFSLVPYAFPAVEETQNNEAIVNVVPSFTPDWVKRAVFYQIFPDRFRDGNSNNSASRSDWLWKKWGITPLLPPWGSRPQGNNDYFGGDLQGVQEKASYLADLGITAIYFNPTMDSTDNHGYTVIDYKSVGRYFGINHRDANGTLILDYNASLEVFRNMTAALDEYGIKVILDGVFNHCSAKNQWFDIDNDYPTDGAYESNMSQWYDWFIFYNWTTKDYKCWYGYEAMPEPEEVDAYKYYVYRANDSVLKFWDDLGVDGWRLDVGESVSHEFWEEFRAYYKALNPEGFIVGEHWGNARDYLQGNEWDSTMNYPFRWAVLDWAKGGSVWSLDNTLNNIRSWYPEEAFYSLFNILDSHDVERALNVLGENKTKMKLAVIFQMTYPGVPVVYYGDEVGLSGSDDPDCRRCYPWADLGGSPDMDLFNHYRRLIAIRKAYPVLSVGSLEKRYLSTVQKMYVLARKYNNSSVALCFYNNGDMAQNVTIDVSDLLPDGALLTDVLNNRVYRVNGTTVTVETRGMWASILISPSAYSCDSYGSPKDAFQAEDYVYVKGGGFPANTSIRLYVAENRTWVDGDNMTDVRGPLGYNVTMTDANGSLPLTCLGLAGNLSDGEWPDYLDIVVDVDSDGVFDAGLDFVDDVTYLPGIVPETITLKVIAILFATCLIAIAITRRKEKPLAKWL